MESSIRNRRTRSSGSRTWPGLKRSQTALLHWSGPGYSYARKVNPLMEDLLESLPYYWVTAQSEYSTDILFKSASHLSELYPRLLSHSTLCFGAKEVLIGLDFGSTTSCAPGDQPTSLRQAWRRKPKKPRGRPISRASRDASASPSTRSCA